MPKKKRDPKEYIDVLERLPKVIDLITKLGIAYYGAYAYKHPSGALVGLIALELAKAQNAIAGASGIATLGAIGLASMDSDFLTPMLLPFKIPKDALEAFKLPFEIAKGIFPIPPELK